MAAVAGSSGGGGRKGGNDPTKKRTPDSKGGYDEDDYEDEEDRPGKGRVKCLVCKRNVPVSLAEHRQDCPQERDWSGEFRCNHVGCGETVRYFGELLRHWRLNHGDEVMPDRLRNRLQ